MTARLPPKAAMWLLQQLGSGYHAESLAGDLLEEYQLGRPPVWYWGQVFAAVGVAHLRIVRTLLSRSLVRTLLRMLVESALLVGVGVGTLTWAGTAAKNTCDTQSCVCPQPQQSP